jgi:ribosomal-protein-alanine N-acetyltransferase
LPNIVSIKIAVQMNMIHLPKFLTERLILRSVTESDLEAWRHNLTDYDVLAHLTENPWCYRFDPQGLAEVQGKSISLWCIFLRENPEHLIGMIYLRHEASPTNRGFWLAKAYWGKGIMSEAVVPIMDYAFETLCLEKVILGNALGNAQSRRVKEKTGAVFVRVESGRYIDPHYTHREIWEMTREAWEAFKASHPAITYYTRFAG